MQNKSDAVMILKLDVLKKFINDFESFIVTETNDETALKGVKREKRPNGDVILDSGDLRRFYKEKTSLNDIIDWEDREILCSVDSVIEQEEAYHNKTLTVSIYIDSLGLMISPTIRLDEEDLKEITRDYLAEKLKW